MASGHSQYETTFVIEDEPKRFPWGCVLAGGCGAVMLLFFGAIIAVLAGGWWFYKSQLNQYTSTASSNLPTVEISEEDLQALENRVKAFNDQVDEGIATEPLILTQDDLNALITKDEDLRGKVFLRIEDGTIIADVSIPTDGLPGGKGRFFNGSVGVEASLKEGRLAIKPTSASVNGQELPKAMLEQIEIDEMLSEIKDDKDMREQLEKYESMVIEEDRIVLTPKPPKPETPPEDSDQGSSDSETTSGEELDPDASAEVGSNESEGAEIEDFETSGVN